MFFWKKKKKTEDDLAEELSAERSVTGGEDTGEGEFAAGDTGAEDAALSDAANDAFSEEMELPDNGIIEEIRNAETAEAEVEADENAAETAEYEAESVAVEEEAEAEEPFDLGAALDYFRKEQGDGGSFGSLGDAFSGIGI